MRWFSKQTETKVSIRFFYNQKGQIEIFIDFPKVKTQVEADAVAKDLADLVISSCRREILPYIQTTIAKRGVETNNEKLASLILIWINNMINPQIVDEDAPVIAADEVFSARGGS